jgi:hypothetical protein
VLSIFRNNQLLYSLFLVFYAGLLHLGSIVFTAPWHPTTAGVLSMDVYGWLGSHTGWAAEITALILLFIQAISINFIVLNHRIGETQNQFSGLFYILLAGIVPEMTHLSPTLMGNTFLIIGLSQIFQIQKGLPASGIIFNAGFWIAFSSLFAPANILFLPVGLAALNLHRGLIFKERLVLISGALTPLLLAGTWYYLNDKADYFFKLQVLEGFGLVKSSPEGSFSAISVAVMMGLVILLVLIRYSSFQHKKTIQIQKKISILYWMLLIAGLSTIFQPVLDTNHWLGAAIPAGILLSLFFTQIKPRWAETLHLFLLAAVLIIHYKPFLLP